MAKKKAVKKGGKTTEAIKPEYSLAEKLIAEVQGHDPRASAAMKIRRWN